MSKSLLKILLLTFAISIAGVNIASAAPIGSVLDFGGNDYLTVADAAVLDQANQLSISIWVKPDTTPAADAYIIYRGNGYYLKQNTSNQIVGAIYYSSAFQTITSSALTLGKWTHIELTYNKDAGGVDELKLYINGVLSAVADHSTAIADTNTALYIGCQNSTPANCFDGKIDDFKLYQYARTADEVKADYNNGLAAHLGGQSSSGGLTSVSKGLVGYWNMEEGKGQTVYDRSGNGNNGTLGVSTAVAKDDPVFTGGYSSAGAGGTALKFDGKNDYVDVGNGASLKTQNFTVGMWFKSNTFNADGLILNGSPLNNIGYGIYAFGANDIEIWLGNGTARTNIQLNSNTKNISTWYYLTVVKNGTNITSYWNGVQEKTGIFNGNIDYGDNSHHILIGNGFDVNYQYWHNGTIDEVRIYNRALSADEIRQHYNQKKPILEMKFDEGSGTSAKDESFNNNDITLVNTPSWLQGKFGSALNFTKTSSQYGYLADNASISLTKDLTISAWVKPASITAATLFDIAGKWDGANESYLLAQYGDEIRLYIDAAANYKTTNAANLQVGQWYHIEGVYNATAQTVKIYINGVETAGTVAGTIPASIGDDAGRFHIGAEDSTAAAANFYDGAIDEAKVYSYARTPAEILVDYNNGVAGHLR